MANEILEQYESFVKSKRRIEVATGHQPGDLNKHLFDFQRAIVGWAVRRGRAAIFADTGLGKTLMQLSWADEVANHTGGIVLVLAPLAVSEQTIEQGRTFGIDVKRVPAGESPSGPGVWITNYERINAIDFESLAGIVLDESSILKSHDGKTRTAIIDACQSIPYRLSCTATPSPNDFEELGNQCEFLGVMTRTEMLATYFVNDAGDTGTWILKGWGQSRFWEWMGTWAVVLRSPADLGFDGSRYDLPKLTYHEHVVETEALGDELFSRPAMTLMERRKAQRNSIQARCEALAEIVNAEPNEPWLIWCHLNDEAELLNEMLTGSVNVQGSDTNDFKIDAISWFTGHRCICGDKRFKWNNQSQEATLSTCAGTSKKTKTDSLSKSGNIEREQKQSDLQSVKNNTQTTLNLEHTQDKKQKTGKKQTLNQDLTNECGSMGLQGLITGECSQSRAGNAPFAVATNAATSEADDSTSITATTPGQLEGCYAYRAITDSASLKTQSKHLMQQQCTCGAASRNQILISKSKMFGYGLNFQHCARVAFVGLDDSFEKFYQAVRRCYRFGQKREVQVHIFTAENEGQILQNIKRKEVLHHDMSANMVEHMKEIMNKELSGQENIVDAYQEATHEGDGFKVHMGDCVKWSRRMADNSVDYSVFSPPFADLFVYSNSDHDMGNCANDAEFVEQLKFLITELYRVIKPGRNVSFHCMNLPTTKMRQGFIGLRDFRGDLIRAFQEAGFIYHSEVCIWKDPVVAMQRTKALGLLHKTIRENGTMSRMGLPDYVVTMRKPGEIEDRVKHGDDLPVAMWQKYASPIWDDINQSRTLNKVAARDDKDQKHMCPLQLDVIERCIHLWTNPGDTVFSPFTGIGSEGYCAVKMGRKFIGTELKPGYYELACQNIEDARKHEQDGLFAVANTEELEAA